MADTCSLLREETHLVIIHMHRVRIPHIAAHPIERFHVGHRAQTLMSECVALLVQATGRSWKRSSV